MVESMSQRAYDYMRQKLSSGELKPGMRLVTRRVAREVGGSLVPVREALSRLASEGLIEHVPGGGAYIRRMSREELLHLYEMREAVEPFAAGLAAARIGESQLGVLQTICDEWLVVVRAMRDEKRPHATASEIDLWLERDRLYHDVIISATGNPFLIKVIADLRLMERVYNPVRRSGDFLTLRVAALSWRAHAALLRALKKRDAPLAQRLMAEQIQSGKRNVLAFLDRQPLSRR